MEKNQKKILRADLFRHLDGIVTAPSAYTLYEKGVLDFLLKTKETSLTELTKTFQCNEGYFNVALHTLASQGWLNHEIINENEIQISLNEKSEIAFQLIPIYEDVVKLMQLSEKYHHRKFEAEPFLFLENIFKKFKENYGIEFSENEVENQIQKTDFKAYRGNHRRANSSCFRNEWNVS